MEIEKLEKAAEPNELADYLAELPQSDHQHGHGGDGSIETLREADHEGHHIVIRTIYQIEVDGAPLDAPLGLDNDGNLHCHSLPNYQFASAVDLVKSLIDNFPDDFKSKKASKKASKKSTAKKGGGHGGGHQGHGSHKSAKKGGK